MPELTGGAQGPFALIQPALGESAQDKIRHYLDQQAAANAGAVAGDPNAPFSGAYAKPPVGGAPGAAPAGPPPMGQASPGPNEPTSTQTPESWGSMLMDLQQQNEAQAGFNSSIGLGLAAFAQPRDREMVSKMFTPTVAPQDPFKMGESLMNMSSQQQGQDRANQIARLVNGPQGQNIADKLGITLDALKTGIVTDPGLPAKIAQAMGTPQPAIAGANQIEVFGKAHGWSPDDIAQAQRLITTGMLPADVIPMQTAALAWQKNHRNQKLPWDPNDPGSYKQYVANQAELNSSAAEAAKVHSTAAPTLIDMQHRVEAIKANPALDSMMSNQAKKDQAQLLLTSDPNLPLAVVIKTLVPSGKMALNPEELQLVSEIRQLNGQEYAAALGSLHQTRPAEKEIAAIRSGIGQTQNISEMSADGYRTQALDNLTENVIKPSIGTSYGASQLLGDMPAEYRTYVPPEFLDGGGRALDNNGSKDWAAGTKITPEEVQTAKNWQKPTSQGGQGLTHAQAVAKVREMGIRPDGV